MSASSKKKLRNEQQTDREALEKGIPVRSEDELNQFLEDFLS